LADAVVEPLTVVIESGHASVAVATVLRPIPNVRLANLAHILESSVVNRYSQLFQALL
jgi:hypothetical protein